MNCAALLLVAACAQQHVALRAPAPNITAADRVATFKALERVDQETLQLSVNNGPWQLRSSTLVLANGARVELPEDLLPVLAPDSATARAARASAAHGNRALTWTYIGFGAIATSVGAILVQDFGGHDLGVNDNVLWTAAGLAVVVPFLVAKHEGNEEMILRMQAFSTYTRDLGLRLDVCARGLEVVACEAPLPPDAPSQAPGMAAPPAGPPAPEAIPAPAP